jgi:two-component system, sensor histidine kinase and response regulator
MYKYNTNTMEMPTILAIDDEPASLRAVTRALADEYRVVTSATAAEALRRLAAEPVAVLVADQRMPEMTGTELLARAARTHPDVVRVLLTGYTDVETLVDAINAGQVYYYLTKPWEPRELRLVVRRGVEHFEGEAERRRLLQELERACGRAQREAAQKGRLLAVAAHELGTPLHVLSNALAFLADAELPAAAGAWLDTAQRSADWLGRGLAQMMTAARWGATRPALHRHPVDLADMVDRLRTMFAPILQIRRLTLHVEVAPSLPAVCADRIWLERALGNLLSNAVRFTPDAGTITLVARADPSAVTVEVTDTGIGIDASRLADVFEPFSPSGGDLSLHASGRFEFGSRGLGLGLAITRAIVTQHGGTISARSRCGEGSQFTVTLPLAAAP